MPQAAAGVVAGWVVAAAGATGAAAAAIYLVTYTLYTLALNKISNLLASRPVDAVSPDPELLTRLWPFMRSHPLFAQLPDGTRIDCFPGLEHALLHPTTLAAASIEGDCLAPEYPSGTIFFHDSALRPRSGDLAIVDSWERHVVSGYGALGRVTGCAERKRVQRVKYVENVEGRWLLHSNDEPYWLPPDERLVGRVVQAVVAPVPADFRERVIEAGLRVLSTASVSPPA